MDGWMDGWVVGWVGGWVCGWKDGWMDDEDDDGWLDAAVASQLQQHLWCGFNIVAIAELGLFVKLLLLLLLPLSSATAASTFLNILQVSMHVAAAVQRLSASPLQVPGRLALTSYVM